jgi:hypothetical protein
MQQMTILPKFVCSLPSILAVMAMAMVFSTLPRSHPQKMHTKSLNGIHRLNIYIYIYIYIYDVKYYNQDFCNLCNQKHGCSGYFLCHQKNWNKKKDQVSEDQSKKRKATATTHSTQSTIKRCCRFRAGHDKHAAKGDTPGFECNTSPSITREGHCFTQHLFYRSPRNTRCMTHTFLFITQEVWRGMLM